MAKAEVTDKTAAGSDSSQERRIVEVDVVLSTDFEV